MAKAKKESDLAYSPDIEQKPVCPSLLDATPEQVAQAIFAGVEPPDPSRRKVRKRARRARPE